jgi:hypothetical protein
MWSLGRRVVCWFRWRGRSGCGVLAQAELGSTPEAPDALSAPDTDSRVGRSIRSNRYVALALGRRCEGWRFVHSSVAVLARSIVNTGCDS